MTKYNIHETARSDDARPRVHAHDVAVGSGQTLRIAREFSYDGRDADEIVLVFGTGTGTQFREAVGTGISFTAAALPDAIKALCALLA